jgi:hypothetical protein
LPKATVRGFRVASGEPAMPLPLKVTVCGLLESLSMKVRVPAWVPVAEGVKVTFSVQEEDTPREVPQLLVSPYCVLAAMLVKVIAVVPVLVMVTGCDALVVVRIWFPKVRVEGLTVRAEGELKEIL